ITFGGIVDGTFSSPVLSGTVIDADGKTQAVNNGANGAPITAVCSLSPCLGPHLGPGSNTFTWGSGPSKIVFTGVDMSQDCGGFTRCHEPNSPLAPFAMFGTGPGQTTRVVANAIFPLGTFAYTNGMDDLNSLVFQVDFHLHLLNATGVNPADSQLMLTA